MNDIDTMDFLGFLRIRAWNAKRLQEAGEPTQENEKRKTAPDGSLFIEDAFPGL